MTFIPQKLNLKQAYKYIDNMFGNWYSKSFVTLDKIIYYYPNIVNFSSDEILYGMLWMYYNYIIDWLDFKYVGKLGDTSEIRFINLFYLKCFLQQSKKTDDEIRKIITTLTTGTGLTSEWINELMTQNKKSMADFVKFYPSSPFNDKRVLQLIKQRNTSKTMFQDDSELLAIMDNKVSTIIQMYRQRKEEARRKLREEAERKRSHIRRGHEQVKEVIFSEETVVEEPKKGILRVKKNVVKTPEEIEAARNRKEKVLRRHKRAIVKAQRAENDSDEEMEEFKEYTGSFNF